MRGIASDHLVNLSIAIRRCVYPSERSYMNVIKTSVWNRKRFDVSVSLGRLAIHWLALAFEYHSKPLQLLRHCDIMLFVRTVSAKDFPHIYHRRNLRKTPPTVAGEGCRTLILIYLCEEAVLIRNQQEYRD